MMRLAKVGLAIVIVVSVASILITPDPSDDVNGVLQQRHAVKAASITVSVVPLHIVPRISVRLAPESLRPMVRSNLLDLVCVLLC
ncbi:MAG: hypothetical protein HY010_22430 [Acidobacteria bacterium]|nr:hypothetical protein [Acidobacteriota bacterium]